MADFRALTNWANIFLTNPSPFSLKHVSSFIPDLQRCIHKSQQKPHMFLQVINHSLKCSTQSHNETLQNCERKVFEFLSLLFVWRRAEMVKNCIDVKNIPFKLVNTEDEDVNRLYRIISNHLSRSSSPICCPVCAVLPSFEFLTENSNLVETRNNWAFSLKWALPLSFIIFQVQCEIQRLSKKIWCF